MGKQDKEVVATLLKAGRRDLAKTFVQHSREVQATSNDQVKVLEKAIKDVRRQIDAEEKKIKEFKGVISPLGDLSGQIVDVMWRKEQEFLGARKKLLVQLQNELAKKKGRL
jgi:hypothetical protein